MRDLPLCFQLVFYALILAWAVLLVLVVKHEHLLDEAERMLREAWALRAAIRRGELPATRLGRDFYVLASDLRAYLGERRVA